MKVACICGPVEKEESVIVSVKPVFTSEICYREYARSAAHEWKNLEGGRPQYAGDMAVLTFEGASPAKPTPDLVLVCVTRLPE